MSDSEDERTEESRSDDERDEPGDPVLSDEPGEPDAESDVQPPPPPPEEEAVEQDSEERALAASPTLDARPKVCLPGGVEHALDKVLEECANSGFGWQFTIGGGEMVVAVKVGLRPGVIMYKRNESGDYVKCTGTTTIREGRKTEVERDEENSHPMPGGMIDFGPLFG